MMERSHEIWSKNRPYKNMDLLKRGSSEWSQCTLLVLGHPLSVTSSPGSGRLAPVLQRQGQTGASSPPLSGQGYPRGPLGSSIRLDPRFFKKPLNPFPSLKSSQLTKTSLAFLNIGIGDMRVIFAFTACIQSVAFYGTNNIRTQELIEEKFR